MDRFHDLSSFEARRTGSHLAMTVSCLSRPIQTDVTRFPSPREML